MILYSENKTDMKAFATTIFVVLILCLNNQVYAEVSQPATDDNATSQEVVDSAITVATTVSWKIEDVQTLRKQISESTTLTDEKKNSILEQYDKAIADFKLIDQYRTQKMKFLQLMKDAPDELEKIQQQLSEPTPEQPEQVTEDMTVGELEQKVAVNKKEFAEINEQVTLLENEPRRRVDRKAKIPEELPVAKEQLDVVKQKLAGFQADPATPELSQAKKIVLEIQQLMHQENIELLEEEQHCYDTTGSLLTAQRDLEARKQTQAAKQLKILEDALTEKRRLQADEIKAQTEQAVAEAKYAHPVIKQLAEANAKLAKQQSEVISEMESSNKYGQTVEQQLVALEADFTDVQKQLEAAEKITNVMGMLLLSKRGDLPDIRSNIEKIKSREGKAAHAQLMWGYYDKKWSKLADTDQQAKQILSSAELSQDEPYYADVLDQTVMLLQEQRKIMRKNSDDYLAYSQTLAKNDIKERKLVEVTKEYAYFVDENILWVRSSTKLTLDQFRNIIPAASWLISPSNWQNLVYVLWEDLVSNWLMYGVFVTATMGLLLMRKLIMGTIAQLTVRSDHKYSDSFKHTTKTLSLTIMLSLPLSALVLFVAWRMNLTAGDDDFTLALSHGLQSVGLVLGVYVFLRNFCFSGGLGKQLDFSDSVLKALRGNFVWFFSLIIPVSFVMEVFRCQQTDITWHDTAGRLCFMVNQVIVAVFLLIVFRPKGKVLGQYIEKKRGRWLNQFRYFWYGACIVVPTSFLIIAEMGYYYAAQHLHRKLVFTILLVGLAVLISAMLRRWFDVLQEKIEINHKRKQMVSENKNDVMSKEGEIENSNVISSDNAIEHNETLLESISRQGTRLIRLVNVLMFVIGYWTIWKNVLPALGILEDIEIWTITDAMGDPVVINVACLAMALLVILLTIIMARNLPGFLQIVLLQRLPIDHGVSFAITAIFRYLIIVVGIVLAFNKIGIGWSKVQWLIAAVSLGLGFGLQEIFANFVSGLIILFEQPIRVGDFVTIGDIDGKVTQIHIRATTVRKFDQKELIVPNREFVTGRLINWTLSDKTLRLEFVVGVAYGSDIKKTEELLYTIAHNHPQVIQDDTVPIVIFSKFGDSSLEFKLRLYITSMDNYLKVWHEINCAIDTEFRKEKIEIAFPQRDLHLRSSDIQIPVGKTTTQVNNDT